MLSLGLCRMLVPAYAVRAACVTLCHYVYGAVRAVCMTMCHYVYGAVCMCNIHTVYGALRMVRPYMPWSCPNSLAPLTTPLPALECSLIANTHCVSQGGLSCFLSKPVLANNTLGTDSGEKPYSCTMCCESFSHRISLNTRTAKVHV